MTMLILLIGAGLFGYALMYKPEYVAVFLFTLIISNINIDIAALPLNLRAIITLALFMRIVTDRDMKMDYPVFAGVGSIKIFLFFLGYIILISMLQDLFSLELVKQTISTILCSFCVYHYYFKSKQLNPLKTATILSGILCFADLAYTYAVFGSFPVQRLYIILTGGEAEVAEEGDMYIATFNHNFFGQICAMAFLFIFADLVKNRKSHHMNVVLLPLMFMGVLMSTSRSALMGMIVVTLIIIMNGIKYNDERKKVFKIGGFAISAVIAAILLFSMLGSYLPLDAKFIDEVAGRLVDEPIAMIQKAMGQNYNAQSLGSMDWREEASQEAFNAYMQLPFAEQISGIGQGGFMARNLGHGLNPHNGILLILIESGLIGFTIYYILIFTLIWQAFKHRNLSPSFGVLVFILIYGIGQNNEMTSSTFFLYVITLAAEIQYKLYGMGKDELQDINNTAFEEQQSSS